MMNSSAIDIKTKTNVTASPAPNDHKSSTKDKRKHQQKSKQNIKAVTPTSVVKDRRSGNDRRLKNMIKNERLDSRNKRDRRAPRLVIEI